MKRNLLIILVSLLFISCASYKSQIVKTRNIESYNSRISISNITIAVEPYDTSQKAKSVFFIDVTTKNIRPLQIIINNESNRNILIDRSEIFLQDTNGKELKQVNSKYVFNLFEKSEMMYAIFGLGLASYQSAQKANDKMQTDWYEKEFPESRTITAKRKADGFIFFETSQHLKGKVVIVNAIDLSTNERIIFKIPIL